jgi:hypothetical protein
VKIDAQSLYGSGVAFAPANRLTTDIVSRKDQHRSGWSRPTTTTLVMGPTYVDTAYVTTAPVDGLLPPGLPAHVVRRRIASPSGCDSCSEEGLLSGARRWAASLLTGGLLLAVGTPAYVAYAQPSMAGYLLHPAVFLLQALPYAVGAALWVPAWSWGADLASVVLAALLLAAALVLYVPVLWAPGRWGGDMIGLAVIAISGATTGVVLVVSGLTALYSWFRRTGSPRSSR